MAYARDDIDKVRERTDLAELASEVTKVKKTGRSVMAVCPFHQEKTPSLSIDASRGLYHCFGCGKGGDVFQWVQETQNLDFVGALELLARRVGVTLTEDPEAAKRRGKREALIGATRAAVDFYNERLKSADDASAARAYVRSRGYDAEIVDHFEIGFSPPGWDELAKHLTNAGIAEAAITGAGLASMGRNNKLIDRFRGRLMFPIYDLRGDPVGFGARLLDGDGPKYLNSSESTIYHKSRLLYGLNWSKSEIVRSDEAVVVEGYTDVIAFHLAGKPVAVATCGTALGEDHLDLLRRFSERVVLAFDSDEAGAGAALRGFEKAVPGDLDLRVAAFPQGRDPADLVADGESEAMLKSVTESIPLLQFRIERDLAGFDLHEAEARGRAVRAVAPLIRQHPDPVVRHEYAVLLSKRTGVALTIIEQAMKARPASSRSDEPPEMRPPPESESAPAPPRRLSGQDKAEVELLRLLLINQVGDREIDPTWFGQPAYLRAYEIIGPVVANLPKGQMPDLGALLGDNAGPPAELLRRIAMEDRPLESVDSVVNRLKEGAVDRRIERERRVLENVDPASQEYSERFTELIALERERRRLREQENEA
ncbi:MAG: DNA primase [bacterium]|nr:DNA primase [bacterium]